MPTTLRLRLHSVDAHAGWRYVSWPTEELNKRMNVEIIGDRDFISSVHEQNGVWVLMAGPLLYALPAEGGSALPVWSSIEKAKEFAQNLTQRDFSPMFVPMGNFLGAAWLEAPSLQFVEVLASPRFGRESLTYTVEELRVRLKT